MRKEELKDQDVKNVMDNAKKLGDKIIETANELELPAPSIIYACLTVTTYIIEHSVKSGIVTKENAMPMAERACKAFILDDLQEFIDNYEK